MNPGLFDEKTLFFSILLEGGGGNDSNNNSSYDFLSAYSEARHPVKCFLYRISFHHPHHSAGQYDFTEEEAEAQGREVVCPVLQLVSGRAGI